MARDEFDLWQVNVTVKTHRERGECSRPVEPPSSVDRRLSLLEKSNDELKAHLIAVRETMSSMGRSLDLVREALVRGDERTCVADDHTTVMGRRRGDARLLPPKGAETSRGRENREANLAKMKASSVVQLSSSGGGYQPQYADVQDSGHRLNPLHIRDSDSGQSNDIIFPIKDSNVKVTNGIDTNF